MFPKIKQYALYIVIPAIAAVALFGTGASAQNYEWVKPGHYQFGQCGGIGGDVVFGNYKHYQKVQCLQTYGSSDKCYTAAKWIEQQMYEKRNDPAYNNCQTYWSNNLNSQLKMCRSVAQRAVSQCQSLAN